MITYDPQKIILDSYELSNFVFNPQRHRGLDGNFHYIYLIVNMINGHYYLGKKSERSDNLDNYMGSGNGIKAALKKYGKSCFQKFFLHFSETAKENVLKEIEVITIDKIKARDCYKP
jgi:hypothetical protein